MHTTMDFTVLHAQRVQRAEREIARRLLVDERRILAPRRGRAVLRTWLRGFVRNPARRRVRSLPSCTAPATPVRRGTMAA